MESKPLCIHASARVEDKIMILVPRKSSKLMAKITVPQTNTGGWVEYTQTFEITELKELGKTASVTSG